MSDLTIEKVYEGKRVGEHAAYMRSFRRPPRPAAERFWEKVRKTDGCWLWTGCKRRRSDYGIFRVSASEPTVSAHRWAYEEAYGSIPAGLYVLHHCDTPRCVRPDHLFLGTQADNVADMIRKERGAANRRSARTRCSNGHAFTPENTYNRANGQGRGCHQCDREKCARHRVKTMKTA